MTVGEVCKRSVATALKNETIVDAANHMRTAHVGDLVVIETQQNRPVPVGIVTDRDIVVGAVAANGGGSVWAVRSWNGHGRRSSTGGRQLGVD